MKNIHAYTEEGFNPAFISVNTEDGKHTVTVRGDGVGAGTGDVVMTTEQLIRLADDIKAALMD